MKRCSKECGISMTTVEHPWVHMGPRILSVCRCLGHLEIFQTKEGHDFQDTNCPRLLGITDTGRGLKPWISKHCMGHPDVCPGQREAMDFHWNTKYPLGYTQISHTNLVFWNPCVSHVWDILRCTKYS